MSNRRVSAKRRAEVSGLTASAPLYKSLNLQPREVTPEGSVDTPPKGALGAWFLGPKAENEQLLQELVGRAIHEHAQARKDYFREDPPWLSERRRTSSSYIESVGQLRKEVKTLLRALQGSVPFYSYRYQGHMLWDVTLPSVVGYFAALLYNQNNVAAEASPVTTWLEMLVGDDLAKLLGFYVPRRDPQTGQYEPVPEGKVMGWGHITCDGSVANMEALWAARNLKYLPLGIAAALRTRPELSRAVGFGVTLPTGETKALVELDTWQLFNLDVGVVLRLIERLKAEYPMPDDIDETLSEYSVQHLGLSTAHRRYASSFAEPVIVSPVTAHYSWPKGAALLGLGRAQSVGVPVDLDARMSIPELRMRLDECLRTRTPVMMVVSVHGSTEESAIDPLADIVELREEYRVRGLTFWLHADAAWGGYFASMLHAPRSEKGKPFKLDNLGDLPESLDSSSVDEHQIFYGPSAVMSDYVRRQYGALPQVDSITVDPHKAGYVPYPAGALCYRDVRSRNLVTFSSPVIYRGDIEPTVGIYGIEGSKPGAAAAAVYLSHRVIPTDVSGYGRIMGRCLWNSKRLYCSLVTMAQPGDPFVIASLQRLECERHGSASDAEREAELAKIGAAAKLSNEDLRRMLVKDDEYRAWFTGLGSDLVILTYAFNFKGRDGRLNDDVEQMNEFNRAIFRKLSLSNPKPEVPEQPLFLTNSQFDPQCYGTRFVSSFTRRLGIEEVPNKPIEFLISTTMDPWLTDTDGGSGSSNFVPVLIRELRKAVLEVYKDSHECCHPTCGSHS
jgi:glutamate/tyrosine decarboxylase-like PLP-dependent enzyme